MLEIDGIAKTFFPDTPNEVGAPRRQSANSDGSVVVIIA